MNTDILTLELLDILERHRGLTSLTIEEAKKLVADKVASYGLTVAEPAPVVIEATVVEAPKVTAPKAPRKTVVK